MLKIRNLQIIFGSILLLLIAADLFTGLSSKYYIGTLIVLLILMAYGSASVRSGMYLRTHNTGDKTKKVIALTFDDGPDRETTPLILDILKNEGIAAAFFCIGNKAEENPDIIKRTDEEGHVVGGHSYTHRYLFDFMWRDGMVDELDKNEEAIRKITGKTMRLFRPPFGVTNPSLAKAVRVKNYETVGWSLRSFDTTAKNEEKLLKRVIKHLKPGDVILFHDRCKITAAILPGFIRYARENGYIFERLDKHLGIEAYE